MPAAAYQGAEYGAIVYGRGAIFVDTLAKEMGREAFDSFMRDYYQSHKWGIGTGEDFRQQAESHCGCDLGPLFEEWVYQ
jgi:aminopeptidase N